MLKLELNFGWSRIAGRALGLLVISRVSAKGATMGYFRKVLFGAACITAATLGFGPAQAAVISSLSSLSLLDLGTGDGSGLQTNAPSSGLAVGISTISYTGSGTGLYSGNSTNNYVSPFSGGSNKNYFAVQTNGSIMFTFAAPQTSFALLFGTIDNYNSITFGTSGGQTFTGADVVAALGISTATTKNALFSGLNSFTTLTARDTQASAFEFVPGTAVVVPEPASLALLITGLIGVSALRRRCPN